MAKSSATIMNLQALRRHLRPIGQLLDANLAAAYREYRAGALSNGAYRYVLVRHATCAAILAPDAKRADLVALYDAAAPLILDASAAIRDIKAPSKKQDAQLKVDALVAHLRACGFVNTVLGRPREAQDTGRAPEGRLKAC